MKKLTAILLTLILLFSVAIALAEEWVCPKCGKKNTTAFCTGCGTKHDIWICPNCGAENSDAFCGDCGTARIYDVTPLLGIWKNKDYGPSFEFNENNVLIAITPFGSYYTGTYEITSNQISMKIKNYVDGIFEYSINENGLAIEDLGAFQKTVEPLVFTVTYTDSSMPYTIQKEKLINFKRCESPDLQRFSIIAIVDPEKENEFLIRRLVGFPGEEIELRGESLFINGEKQDEDNFNVVNKSENYRQFGPYTIPDKKCFVMNDHRNTPIDNQTIGTIDSNMIVGVITQLTGVDIQAAEIKGLSWARSVNIEKYEVFNESGWELPGNAIKTDEKLEIHHYEQILDHYEVAEVERSRQVIDHYETYYTYTDNGDGTYTEEAHERPVYETEYYTETVQQPVYRSEPKYLTKYYYNIKRLVPSRDVTVTGDGHDIYWPETNLSENEREGKKTEDYWLDLLYGDQEIRCQTTEDFYNKVNLNEPIYLATKAGSTETYISDQYGLYRADYNMEGTN